MVSAGERESAIVHCRDIHGNYFKLQKKLKFTLDLRPRVSERPLNYSFVDHLNGTYTTMFTVYVSGSYTLTIRLFGSPIKNNPYQFSVIPGMDLNYPKFFIQLQEFTVVCSLERWDNIRKCKHTLFVIIDFVKVLLYIQFSSSRHTRMKCM